jgi:DNA modification methylase
MCRVTAAAVGLLPAFVGVPAVNRVYNVDALTLLRAMASASVNCIVTSPPYFNLRDYGIPGQIGNEETPQQFVAKLVELFREARRVLRDDGTFWLNLGDTYTGGGRGDTPPLNTRNWKQGTNNGSLINERTDVQGLPSKSLIGIPWRVAFGLQDDGWILRSDIIWHKPNPMPESVTDRPTKAHEYVFLFAKSQRYFYDADAIREPLVRVWGENNIGENNVWVTGEATGKVLGRKTNPNSGIATSSPNELGRNKRSVWSITTEPFSGAHFATFPTKLIEPMILAGCPVGGVVYDPFMGSGTTALVARKHGRDYIGSELNPDYAKIARDRLDAPYTPSFMPQLETASA